MKKLFSRVFVCLCLFGVQAMAFAAERGSADEAVALVKKAIAYIKTNGREKAFAEFSNPSGQFKDRDLYIMVYDMDGNNKAHGANAKLIGKNLSAIKDADGNFIVQSFIEVASGKGHGWVDYKWPNPVSNAVEPKSTYVEKFEDILLGCGIYK
ncbi:MAG TPA: cache domain-containing protein [Noviherbaspirillum sp.]|nr:cache domain-containing protein [Noviherbaspirillum sp.]